MNIRRQPTGWTVAVLEDLVLLQRGFDITKANQKPGDIPVISSSGVGSYHDTAMANGPGVVIGRKGTVGVLHFAPKDYWPHDTTLFSKDLKGNDARYVYYFLQTLGLQRFDVGNSNPTLNRNHIHKLEVVIPPLSDQVKIASRLSTCDDLIDINRRRIALLEQSARLLYREWFVHLRFPGHEHVKVEDGVPEGWEARRLEEFSDEVRVSVKPEAIPSGTPYIGLEHMPRRSITLAAWGRSDDVASQKFAYAAGDVLFGKIRPYFHKVGFTLTDGITSSDAIVVRPREKSLHAFLLLLLSSDHFVALASQTVKEGSKMPRADWKYMRKQHFAVPPESLLGELNGICRPIFDQLKTLARTNEKLSEARDLLLPRLMSGEIEV